MKLTRFTLIALVALPFAAGCSDTPLTPGNEASSPSFARASAGLSVGDTYILTAGRWTARQTREVEKLGGEVIFSHEADGVAVVRSADPDFLVAAERSNSFSGVAPDVMIQGVKPVGLAELEDAAPPAGASFDPNDDTFYGFYQWNMRAVGADAAWAEGCTGEGVRIAVLDGGISSGHLDIAPNLDVAASASFVPGYAFDEDDDTDDDGPFRHASHVAGIAAAPANGIGTIGVAPDATIVGVKVLHGGSGAFSWILQGIYYAATPVADGGAGADIINMSLGGTVQKNLPGAGQLVAAYNKAMNTAARNGVLVVSSAGNDYADLDHNGNLIKIPAESGNGIAISATAPNGYAVGATDFSSPASYTNYGNSAIHVAAPGGDFDYPEYPTYLYDMILSPGAGTGTYYFAAGTSMSAPMVSGVAALILGQHPDMSVGRLKTAIARTADDEGEPGHDPYYGSGFVNAYKACTM
jgi:subtilisin family serine protease